jgi:hypothetical protein
LHDKHASHSAGLFYAHRTRNIEESLSAVSLGKPLTFGGFAVRQAHAQRN